MGNMPSQKTDVLIIGGGGAGVRAAIEAAAQGCRVVVANKGPVGRSGTTPMSMEAFQAVCSPGDSVELHFQDTVEGGRYLGDENLISVLVLEAAERARDLENYGVQFKKKPDGSYDPMHHPGQTLPRTLFTRGGGFGMLFALIREARKNSAVRFFNDVLVTRLLLDREGAACGALYLDLKDGGWKTLRSKAVVLATGGYEELWAFNDAACTACGDGVFLAYDAGARVVDLEMLQFYPTVVIHPPSIQGTLFQYELITNPDVLGGRILNGKMEPFFEGILLRDAIVRALWKEIREERASPHGGVFIDLVHSSKNRKALTEALEKWQPNQFHYLRDMGFDLREKLIEVAPHAHYAMGGVAIDEEGRTTVPGLFAAGEVAGNLHGANRVSGNALAETQVFGARAGKSAAQWAGKRSSENKLDCSKDLIGSNRLRERLSELQPWQARERMRRIMWQRCGIERDARNLRLGLEQLADLEKEIFIADFPGFTAGPYPQDLFEALELQMMLPLCRLVLRSALFREETRGHHMRTDFPSTKEEPVHTIMVKGQEPCEEKVKRKGTGR